MPKQLLETITKIHFESYQLCKEAFGRYFANAGNIGIFCHGDDEYGYLTKIREELTEPSNNPNQKYYTLKDPIIIPGKDAVPETTYKYLYIRKPDPSAYGQHSGDVDFYTDAEYESLIKQVADGLIPGAELYEQAGVGTLIQISNQNIEALAYISKKEMTEKIRVRQV